MDFARPELLNLFFLIPVLIIVFLFYYRWQKSIISTNFTPKIWNQVSPNYSGSLKVIHFVLKILALIFLIFSLCGPRMGVKLKTIKREGVDIIFALDVSKSMLVEDVAPNRLMKSVQIVSKSIDNLVSDRVGLIIYAGQAYPLMPLSFDYSMAKLLIKTIDTNTISSQGTDISSALILANSFFDKKERSKILFVLSDGEDHEGDFESQINLLSENDVIVSSINLGTESGGPIPISSQGGVEYKKDKNNNVIISKSNTNTLSFLASSTSGRFIKTKITNEAVEFVLNNIKSLDKTFQEEEEYSDYEEQFQWFLGFSLFFVLLDFLLTHRKINFIKND